MGLGKSVGNGIAAGQRSATSPISINNPVFKAKLLSVDDRLEQPAGSENQSHKSLNVGQPVSGKEVNNKDKTYRGRIKKILKAVDGKILSIIITDEVGGIIKLDPETVSKLDFHNSENGLRNNTQNLVERKVLLYESWVLNKK